MRQVATGRDATIRLSSRAVAAACYCLQQVADREDKGNPWTSISVEDAAKMFPKTRPGQALKQKKPSEDDILRRYDPVARH